VITTADHQLHALLTHQLAPDDAIADGLVELDGDPAALPRLLELFTFPAIGPPPGF
jgi:hypothetical protein